MEQTDQFRESLPLFLIELLQDQYGSEWTEKILSGYTKKRHVTLRVNTLKSSLAETLEVLQNSGITYQTVPWYENALILDNTDENVLRELSLYKEGKIYLQSLSSMIPPLVLNPRAGADILDMTAAPGGKTTQMAAMTENRAHITACELNSVRAERLRYNVQKQGASCVLVMQKDARQLDNFFAFDQILLDAPCSGSGVLSTLDKNANTHYTRQLIDKSVKTQKALISKAAELLKKGQQMVYSTCSILACENEDIISYAVSKKKLKLVSIETEEWNDLTLLPVKQKGVVCIAPNEFYEGFFIAKLEKI